MTKRFACIGVACLLAVTALTVASAQQVQPASNTTATVSVDDALKAVRNDLQGNRADIIAKNVSLSADQAAKFWPVFQKYQAEQNAIMVAQMKSLQAYVDGYDKLDDAGALALIQAHLDRDAKMVALRQRWLEEFQQVLPTRLAVRVMQIDRRISLAHQIEFASRIPLAH